MTEIQRIQDQLKHAFEGGAWHNPSVKEALSGVTAQQAASKPIPNAHSIWEITLHIAGWVGAIKQRLEGNWVDEPPEGDWPAVKDTTEAAWKTTLELLEKNHRELQKTISRFSDSDLDKQVAEGKATVYVILHVLIQHDLYHAGQISILRKGAK